MAEFIFKYEDVVDWLLDLVVLGINTALCENMLN